MIKILLQQVKKKEDDWYSQKEIYAFPDWFILASQPKLVYLLSIYGANGLEIIKQKANFEISFKHKDSILQYANFLEHQMNKELPIIGFVLFYEKNIIGIKDIQYNFDLTISQKLEIEQYNLHQNQVEVSTAYFDSNYNLVDSLY